jgi:protein arginine N-methyltransferase 2
LDLEDFQTLMVKILAKPHGMYSFFNGLAPDNLFFHGVACQCVKLQLGALGLDTEFWPCQIQVPDTEIWKGIRRQYWHNRDTYYLPVVTWNAEYLATGKTCQQLQTILESAANQPKRKVLDRPGENTNQNVKRQQQQQQQWASSNGV